ncbi:MAG: IS481 family transposase, partial [Pseudomonadota bacterium]
NHPWTNDQVERMNRTIEDATAKRSPSDSPERLRRPLADLLDAHTFARRLTGLTPSEYICKIWTPEPHRSLVDPLHQMPGLNT